jgi:hypothetical protein
LLLACLQTRKDEARSHLSQVWSIDDVPDAIRDGLASPKMLAWLGASKQQAKKAAAVEVPVIAVLDRRRLYDVYDFLLEG